MFQNDAQVSELYDGSPAENFMGAVNYVRNNTVYGWAWNSSKPGERVIVDLVLDQNVIDCVVAQGFRQDLVEAGIGDGRHAFELELPARFLDGVKRHFSICFANGSTLKKGDFEWASTEAIARIVRDDFADGQRPAPAHIRSDVNYLRGRDIHGWAWNSLEPNEKLGIELFYKGELIAETTASNFRADIKKAGVGDGKHGFKIRVPDRFCDGGIYEFDVQFPDGTAVRRGRVEFGPVFGKTKMMSAKPDDAKSADLGKSVSIARSDADSVDEIAGRDEISKTNLTTDEQLKLLASTKMVHKKWYASTYADVAATGMDPAIHYLFYGAAMGRDPGKTFSTNFYLNEYPEVSTSGMNPLVHYALVGSRRGYKTKAAPSPYLNKVKSTKNKLLSLGFNEPALSDFRDVMENSDDEEAIDLADREMMLWHIRLKTEEGYLAALDYALRSRGRSKSLDHRRRMVTAAFICYFFLGREEDALDLYEAAAIAGELTADALLAWSNFLRTPEEKIACINRVLDEFEIEPVGLTAALSDSPYDRLAPGGDVPKTSEGPLVTVLIAAYEAGSQLPTALRSLQQQSWQNLEILVLDDCSPTSETKDVVERFAVDDARIRYILMDQNGGAYNARNRGLDEARGTYVTLHDADDWSHPRKIETQVRFLEGNPACIACTTQQARATDDLVFWRLNGEGKLVNLNSSSLMFRREDVREICGYWDDVRFGADTEFIKRIVSAFGKNSLKRIPSGPLSFQRISDSSIVGNPHFGFEGFHYGVRFLYHEAYRNYSSGDRAEHFHNNSKMRFATPNVMRKDRIKVGSERHFDVIVSSDFRMSGGSTRSSIEEMLCHDKFGVSQAHFHMFRYDLEKPKSVYSVLSDSFDTSNLNVLGYGERATCDLLILRYPPILQHRQRYLPTIDAKHIKVIVNQPPMSDYSDQGQLRYDLASCAENLRAQFGKDAEWHPIGPLVREALHTHHADELRHINLSDKDWLNVIDLAGWSRGERRRSPSDRLRIGRHSRNHEHKWPHRREDILAAYPDTNDVEVHVLGGASAPASLIGGVPSNWTVHEFGSIHPRDFLSEIDVYIYFAHPDWVESFGRVIIEAMAVGVPVILPDVYEPLFKDSVLYGTPQTAVGIAKELHANPDLYNARVIKAQKYVQDNFSYETHIARLNEYRS